MAVPSSAEKDLFLAALEKATPAERAAFLEQACAGDAALRQRVEALLAADGQPDSLLDQPAASVPDGVGAKTPTPTQTIAAPAKARPPAADGDDAPLVFLEPPGEAGSLGRLDHYEVLEVIGRGGMGMVLKARDTKLHRVVAIKVMALQLAASGSARKRFVREARAAAAVRDEHVVGIYAVADDGPVPYLVMEYIGGTTLADRISQDGPLQTREVLRIGMQAARGLAAAHAQGLIHRDIKPPNILLENGVERVKITDFGLARAADDASLTQSGLVAGTPQYMSPEQASGHPVDHRSDLFSLGSTLYAMCTGRPPFRAPETMAVLKRICEDTPRPIRETNPEVPQWLCDIVDKLHAKKPEDRYQSAQEVADVLAQRLAQIQLRGSTVLEPPPRPPDQSSAPSETPSAAAGRRGRRRYMLAATLLAAVALVVAGLAVFKPWRDSNHSTKGPEADDAPVKGAKPSPAQARAWQPSPLPSAQELARLPSPLDGRRVEDLPAELLPPAPLELAAVLGDRRFQLTGEELHGPAMTRDGRLLAIPCGSRAFLFDAPSGRLLRTFSGPTSTVNSVAFSADGKRLLGGAADNRVRCWEVETGRLLRTFKGHDHHVQTVLFGPGDKTVISSSTDQTVRVWDAQTGKERYRHPHPHHCNPVAVSPDGHWLASGCHDGTVRVWELDSGVLKHTLLTGNADGSGVGVGFSPDGKWLATGGAGEVKLWNASTFQEVRTVPLTAGAAWRGFGPDSRTVFAWRSWHGERFVVTRWDVTTGKRVGELRLKNQGGWAAIGLSPDAKTVFAARANPNPEPYLRAYDSETGEERFTRAGHTAPLAAVAVRPDGRALASAAEDGSVLLWDLTTGKELRRFSGPSGAVTRLVFSPDGARLAAGGLDQTARVWDVEGGQVVHEFRHPGPVSGLAFKPDGSGLTCGTKDDIFFWDMASGALAPRPIPLPGAGVFFGLAYDREGNRLVTAGHSDRQLRVWDLAAHQETHAAPVPFAAGTIALRPDGKEVALAADALYLCDLTTGQSRQLPGQPTNVKAIAYRPDGKLLAAAAEDGTLGLWDLTTDPPRLVRCPLPHLKRAPADIAFTPDGRYLATANPDGTACVLRLAKPGEVFQVSVQAKK